LNVVDGKLGDATQRLKSLIVIFIVIFIVILGNEKLRQLARLVAKAYNTSNKKGKSNIARGLVMKVRQMEPAGRFLKRNPVTSEWEGKPILLLRHSIESFL
jgi:hypothetical protein